MIDDSDSEWILKPDSAKSLALSEADETLLAGIEQRFSAMNTTQLIQYTYKHFPFYALNSTILNRNLSASEIENVRNSIKRDTTPTLFTIGYEGKSLEEFINILLKNNIPLLCDVRKNAYSMKYGFSKTTLMNACAHAGITYLHIPELGIDSSQRKSLETKEDYKLLFNNYKKTVLAETREKQKKLLQQIEKTGRAALMCFEADPAMCHRSHLSLSLLAITRSNLPLVSL